MPKQEVHSTMKAGGMLNCACLGCDLLNLKLGPAGFVKKCTKSGTRRLVQAVKLENVVGGHL